MEYTIGNIHIVGGAGYYKVECLNCGWREYTEDKERAWFGPEHVCSPDAVKAYEAEKEEE